jgi:inosine-uridine nucleoside N-ribohydrolase
MIDIGKRELLCFVLAAVTAPATLLPAAPPRAREVLFFDDFNNGNLAAGGEHTTNAGFKGNAKVSESGGNAVLDCSAGRWATATMQSRKPFDPTSAGRLVWTTDVDRWTGSDMDKRFAVGLQPAAGGNVTGRGLIIELTNTGSQFRLLAQDAAGKKKLDTLYRDGALDVMELADGFTVRVEADRKGWEITFAGAANLGDEGDGDNVVSGKWGTSGFGELFTDATYVNAYNKNGVIPTAAAEIDAIQVSSGGPVPFEDDPDPDRRVKVKPPEPVKNRSPVIFDTDIGDDIDDTWALALLLKCPELDVRLVVSDEGKREYRSKLLAKMLEAAGRTDVAVGKGVPVNIRKGRHKIRNWQHGWVADYNLERYPGTVHEDGVKAMIDVIMDVGTAERPVTVITAGPVTNLQEALRRRPDIAKRARWIGMLGKIGKQTNESNVMADPDAVRAVFRAPWDKTVTPVDTTGRIRLMGEEYLPIRDSDDPLLDALVENYRIWSKDWLKVRGKRYDAWGSSTLFDTLAVYLAATGDVDELVAMKTLKLVVEAKKPGDGKTLVDPDGRPVRVALEWTSPDGLEKYKSWLRNRLLSPTVKPQPLPEGLNTGRAAALRADDATCCASIHRR